MVAILMMTLLQVQCCKLRDGGIVIDDSHADDEMGMTMTVMMTMMTVTI